MKPPRILAAVMLAGGVLACGLSSAAGDEPARLPAAPAGQLPPPARLPTAEEAAQPAYARHLPEAPSRPDSWPTGRAAEAVKGVLSSIRVQPGQPLPDDQPVTGGEVVPAQFTESAAAGQGPAPLPEATSLEAALVVARIGPEVVLEADLLTPKALEWLAQISPGLPPEKVRELRLQICQQVINQHIETLLVYVDACRELPADKLPEIRKNVDKAFDEHQLPRLMEDEGVTNSLEFEQRLRERGMSLERMRKMFFERGLAQEWMRKNTMASEEIAHADLIAWYQNHLEDYEYPARARFEVLTVKTGLKRSRAEAWEILAGMGNEVLAGRPFAEVAKGRSEGPTAAAGGAFDWTTQGSLAAQKLNEAIFSLPVGELSAIIEDGEAVHIVRVLERQEAGRTSFIEAQVGIRKQLLEERRRTGVDEYLAKLRARTPVWTVFDDPQGSASDPVFTAGRPAAPPVRR
jgi:hypothetical protein